MLHSDSDATRLEILDAISDKDFADPFTRDIFLLSQSLFIEGIRPTTVEIFKEGMKYGYIKSQQDREKIAEISQHYIDDDNISYWIGKVRDASKGRALQRFTKKLTHGLSKETTDIPELIREASGELFALAMDAEAGRTLTGKDLAKYGKELIKERVEAYRKAKQDERFPGELPLEGVPTGLPTIDKLSLGYKPGDLILLAAQTGHGKTAFAINTARAVCIEAGRKMHYINTEMSKKQLVYRWGSVLSGEIMQQLRVGSLTNAQMEKVLDAFDSLAQAGFYADTETSPTPAKVDILARKAKMQYGIELMCLDYVGRMEKLERGKEEWQVLEQIVKSQKQLAQDQEIAVMILAQLNDDGSLQGAKRMRNECDMIFKLLPAKKGLKVDLSQSAIEEILKKKFEQFNYVIYVDKARDFETGRYIPLVFDLERQQIREAKELSNGYPPPPTPKEKPKAPDSWGELGKEIEYPD